MKILLSTMMVAALTLTGCANNTDTVVSEEHVTPVNQVTEKLSFSASQSIESTATVEAINRETREVTLRRNDGSKTSIIASEDARNLDQVQVGDLVVAQYEEEITIEVVSVDNAEAGISSATAVSRTEKGDMPGAAEVNIVVITATVEDINLEANTFKLKGPEGDILEYTARNPENLKKAAVGDLVIITSTRSIAFAVEKVK